MKFKKRGDGAQDAVPAPEEAASGRQKPVFIYIIILFTVAFALILVSFVMHQRSNQQVLGELHNNVNAIEELQDALDENLQLQKAIERAQKELSSTEEQLESEQAQRKSKEDESSALLGLYCLQQQYSAGDYAQCQASIDQYEKSGVMDALPKESGNADVVSPFQRYQQLKEGVAQKMAEPAE
ncbi:hypothetical protein KQI82_02375 [Oscillibacter sp. MSJ-2]|uniref:Uncharacterized protein n=1 Tax=Dysosmobacter acutus TaxID=2841504 RepID=A0ABS6F8U4_9FIRM|nr:hypothetical protein [Dysosmobacter acutus]MBU5625780.1 hypothetical protein [Dysosmobacter acutus]